MKWKFLVSNQQLKRRCVMGQDIKIDKKDMDRLKKDKEGDKKPAETKPPVNPGKLALRCLAIVIAAAYFVLLFFGKYFLPADGEFMASLDIFADGEAPNRWIRILSLSILTLSVSAVLRFLIGRMANNKAITKKTGVAVIELLGNLVKYVVILVLVFLILSALGVDTTSLLASLGILGLILGLGATSLIEDIVAGEYLSLRSTCLT